MTSLLILGNTNVYTFGNSIVAANVRSLDLFESPLKNIFVFHSQESEKNIRSPKSEQKTKEISDFEKFLEDNGLSQDLFINRVIDLSQSSEAVPTFIKYIEFVIQGLNEKSKLIIDITNGTSLQKNLFSVATYTLNEKNQYAIDVVKLGKILGKTMKEIKFVEPAVLNQVYSKLPDNIDFDDIAHLDLSEMVRYKSKISSYEKQYSDIDKELADWQFFRDNLHHSVRLKLQGDKNKDNTLYRISSASIASSTEDLLSLLIRKFFPSECSDKLMLGNKISIIEAGLAKGLFPKPDYEFLKKFNEFMLYLRNKTTHKDDLLSDLERFKADLSLKMSFPFLEFYIEIIYPILSKKLTEIPEMEEVPEKNFKSDKIKVLASSQIGIDRLAYYGLDGDDTGRALEKLFCSSTDEKEFTKLSKSIQKAVKEISNLIRQKTDKTSQNQTIIFETGDDILFKGLFNEEDLQKMQNKYHATTGMTCSIGYGWTLQSAYVALKIAKAQPGKNFIYGVEID